MKLHLFAAVALATIACAAPARADGWLPTLWNPFATTPAKPAVVPARPIAPQPAQPTVLEQFSSGTQQAWSNTTRFLNPWSAPAAPPKRPKISGTRRVVPSQRRVDPEDKTSWLPWQWFDDDEEPAPTYDTPSDWLALPRPQ